MHHRLAYMLIICTQTCLHADHMEVFSQLRFPPPTYVSSWWQIVTNWYKTSQHTHIALKYYFPSYFSSVENIYNIKSCWAWWCTIVLGQRQEDLCEPGASLVFILSFRPAELHSETLSWKREGGRKRGKRRVHWINHWERSISHLVISKISYFCLTVGLLITADKRYYRSPNYLLSVFTKMPSQRKWGKEFAFSSRGKLGSFPGTTSMSWI